MKKKIGVVVDGNNGEMVNAITTRDFGNDRWVAASQRRFNGLGETEGESVWRGSFFFAQLADTQFGAIEQNLTDAPEIELATKAIETLNKLQPKYAIICGDLVNHVPEMYPKEDPNIRNLQVANFKKVMEKLDCKIPLVCVCGNHDVDNSPTSHTISRYVSEFGDDYFTFWTGGVCNIVLNSNTYYDPANCQDYHNAQHLWLEEELKSARAANAQHIMVFCHHPLWLVHPNETEDPEEIGFLEFTVKSGAVIKIPNTYFHIEKERRLQILSLMKKYNAKYVFSGHWHKNLIVKSEEHDVTNYVTSAVGLQLGGDKPGYRLVKVFDDDIEQEYFSFEEMPTSVDLTKRNSKTLNNSDSCCSSNSTCSRKQSNEIIF